MRSGGAAAEVNVAVVADLAAARLAFAIVPHRGTVFESMGLMDKMGPGIDHPGVEEE